MTATAITDHAEQAIVKLIPPFWGLPRIAAIMLSWLTEVQELDDTIATTLVIRELATADDPRLVILGKIVGQPNFGYPTETYRRVIQARISANQSEGLGADLLRIAHLLFDPTTGDAPLITIREGGIASVLITVWGDTADALFEAPNVILPDSRSGGVALELFLRSASTASEIIETFIGGDTNVPATGTPGWSVSRQ